MIVMAYIIGALGGSLPLPGGIGTIGGMAGVFILFGVGRDTAISAVLLYQAVGLPGRGWDRLRRHSPQPRADRRLCSREDAGDPTEALA